MESSISSSYATGVRGASDAGLFLAVLSPASMSSIVYHAAYYASIAYALVYGFMLIDLLLSIVSPSKVRPERSSCEGDNIKTVIS